MDMISCFSFALVISLFNCVTLCSGAAIPNSATDKQALLSFKNSITSDPDAILTTNWSDDTSVCNWIGVSCLGVHPGRITAVNLSGYDLAGTLPPHLGNLTSLRYLDISFNNFTGFLPFHLSNLHRLKVMNAAVNSFTGEIPTWLGSLPHLERLALNNNGFSGRIPSSLFEMSKLQVLDLSFNLLGGNIPNEIGNSSSLKSVKLSYNQLSGSIPRGMFNVSSMREIRIMNNSLSGSLPIDMCDNVPNLETLSLSTNQLSGEIPPNIWKCRHLKLLELSLNHFNGKIPSEIVSLSMLRELYLGRNDFRGGVPPEIGNLSRLEILSIRGASLTGNIPSSIFNISSLTFLSFSNNSFSESIPTFHNLPKLQKLYLNNNKLTGQIPPNLWKYCKHLEVLVLSFNSLSGSIPSEIGNMSMLRALDLGFNGFAGDIPSSIDGCQSLEYLNLSSNELSGAIPKSLGNVISLKALDLSNNSLSGLVPRSLSNIKSLWDFNVSYNRLEGEIPNEGCFVNFTPQSFVNNFGLCGPTKFQVPPCLKNHGGSRVGSFSQLMKYIALSLIVVVILVIAMVMLMLRRRKNKKKVSPTSNILQGIEWRKITYIELERGTSSFSETNLLGKGGFGSVFQATLSDGLRVAAKVFDLQLERVAQSFDNESELLSTIRHRNIVHVIGCCSNMEFKALILEYMPNGSLEKWLYSGNYCLDLVQRVKIALDVALALEYLHHGYRFPIVHCDIKPCNVLLDEDMTARVGDFGIAKLFEKGEDVIQTKTLMATTGYAAPEYGSEGKISTNGDVYSYGIMLLEMFTRKKPTDDMFKGEMDLKVWVSDALEENAISKILDPDLLTREDRHFSVKEQCVTSIFNLAIKCVAISPIERINMIEAAAALQKINATFIAGTTRLQRHTNFH